MRMMMVLGENDDGVCENDDGVLERMMMVFWERMMMVF